MAALGVEDTVLEEQDNLHPYSEPLDGGPGQGPEGPQGAPKGFCARLRWFVCADHTYVFLGTSAFVLFALGLAALTGLGGGAPARVCVLACLAWLALSLVALVNRIVAGKRYRSSSPLCSARGRVIVRVLSYLVWAAALVVIACGPVAAFVGVVSSAIAAPQKPQDFLGSMAYMVWNGRAMFATGVVTTIQLALFGTVIAFFLALLLVFLRIQTPDRSDNDAARFFKWLGATFAKFYSTVVRGTPMMVQGAIMFYAGLAVLRGSGMTVTEINGVWTPFLAGLVTISLNSTAYMMEVLRGGIEAVDGGQMEAARSLGLSQWQAMRKVVFPQGIKNSIPALSNELIVNIKDSSVLSIIGVFDLMFATTSVIGIYYSGLENYVAAALIYLVLTMAFSKVLTLLAKRLDVEAPGPVGSTADAPKPKKAA